MDIDCGLHGTGWLERCGQDDGLKVRELMWHYYKGDMKAEAGKYYGREGWQFSGVTIDRNNVYQGGELEAATKVIAEVITEGEQKSNTPDTNNGIIWIFDVVKQADVVAKKCICDNVNFRLLPSLVSETRLPTRLHCAKLNLKEQNMLLEKNPEDAQAARDVSISLNNLGKIQLQLGNPKEALDHFKRMNTILEELKTKNPEDAQTARDLWYSYVILYETEYGCNNINQTFLYAQKLIDIMSEMEQ